MLDSAHELWLDARIVDGAAGEDAERTRAERDLYLRLLQLGSHGEIKPLLHEALTLIVGAIGARLAYLELNVDGDATHAMRWFAAHGLDESEIERVRAAISRGIIAEALATRTTRSSPRRRCSTRASRRARASRSR